MTERLGECPDWSRLPAAGWPWLQEQRRQAWRLFEAAGLPEPHVEAWKYTRLDDLPARGFMIGRDGVPDEGAQPADTPWAVICCCSGADVTAPGSPGGCRCRRVSSCCRFMRP
ncbi:hypothetical protein [Marinobacterium aestuariivivens]|uniref:Fe-S cluster assembly protein SufD n=1 Tax=Marinobacterium aestuariivivens TaxID=1698799 RepID=A0ABW2A6W9_9GAMM